MERRQLPAQRAGQDAVVEQGSGLRARARPTLLALSLRLSPGLALDGVACSLPPTSQVSSSVFTPGARDDGGRGRAISSAIRPSRGPADSVPPQDARRQEGGLHRLPRERDKGPVAGLPSVKTCMICHESIATDRPLIQQITGSAETGIDMPWQRVYGYAARRTCGSTTRRTSAPRSTARPATAIIGQQTVAERERRSQMGFCVELSQAEEGAERVSDMSLLTWHELASSWKLAHGSPRLHQAHRRHRHQRHARELRQSGASAHPLHSRRRDRARRGRVEAERVPAVRRPAAA